MRDLIERLPPFYRNSPEMVTIQASLTGLARELWADRNDWAEQLCPDTATWGLSIWEEAVGIPTDRTRPYAYRRSRVIAKLRGAGTTTVAKIKSVAESFSGGEVEVIEDAAHYRVSIKFTGTLGVPPNMDDLTATLREILPAHLGWSYEIVWNLWRDIAPFTWAEIASLDWDGVKEEDLTEL